jgi:hypothetical protein
MELSSMSYPDFRDARRGYNAAETDRMFQVASLIDAAILAMRAEGVDLHVVERVKNRLLYGVPYGPDETATLPDPAVRNWDLP